MSVNTHWECGALVRLEQCSLVRFLCNHAWAVSETTVPQTRKVAAVMFDRLSRSNQNMTADGRSGSCSGGQVFAVLCISGGRNNGRVIKRCGTTGFFLLCTGGLQTNSVHVATCCIGLCTCKSVAGRDCSPLVSRHVSDVVLYKTMVPGVTTPLKNLIKAVGGCQYGGVRRSLAAGRLLC